LKRQCTNTIDVVRPARSLGKNAASGTIRSGPPLDPTRKPARHPLAAHDKQNNCSVYGAAVRPGQFSRTAEFMALFRALESAQSAHRRLFHDPFATLFLSASLRRMVQCSAMPILGPALQQIIDHSWPGARSSGVARTRLIDDWIEASIANGSQQLVILGAGFDSRAWRMPVLAGLPIFELDHAATATKKRRVAAAVAAERLNIVSITLDFDRDRLPDALAAAGFDPKRCSTVVWEGVTNYLTGDTVRSVLAWVGNLAAGSTLIFTYVHRGVIADPTSFEGAERILRTVANAGEPWTFGFLPETLPRCLQAHGLRLVEDLGADDYRSRYFGPKARRMRGYAFYCAAFATVAGGNA
jgi:methyltransferase (TIGR00027 family)